MYYICSVLKEFIMLFILSLMNMMGIWLNCCKEKSCKNALWSIYIYNVFMLWTLIILLQSFFRNNSSMPEKLFTKRLLHKTSFGKLSYFYLLIFPSKWYETLLDWVCNSVIVMLYNTFRISSSPRLFHEYL